MIHVNLLLANIRIGAFGEFKFEITSYRRGKHPDTIRKKAYPHTLRDLVPYLEYDEAYSMIA